MVFRRVFLKGRKQLLINADIIFIILSFFATLLQAAIWARSGLGRLPHSLLLFFAEKAFDLLDKGWVAFRGHLFF